MQLSTDVPSNAGGAAEAEAEEFARAFQLVSRFVGKALPAIRQVAPVAVRAIQDLASSPAAMAWVQSARDANSGGSEDARAGDPYDRTFDSFETEDGFTFSEGEEEGGDAEANSEEEAMADVLAYAAGTVEGESEADQLAGGVTIYIVGPAPIAIRRVSPALLAGGQRLVRVLRRHPQTRPLTPLVARVQRQTVRSLKRGVELGHPVTPRVALGVLARNTNGVLSDPRRLSRTVATSLVQRARLLRRNRNQLN